MNRRSSIAALLIAMLFIPEAAYPWGVRAHSVIDHTAVDMLPEDGPVFLKKYAGYIAGSASIPDTWRGASEPFSKIEEDPNHGWFREQFAFINVVPRSRYEFVLELYREYLRIEKTDPESAKRMNVRWTGTLPYAAAEVYGHLVATMRLLRRERAAGRDTAFLEQTCAFYVAWMGHYIGDGSQPLHDTIHHDGWQGPDPKGYTRDPKIHGRFETSYVDVITLTEQDIAPRVGKPSNLQGDVFDLILAHLDEAGSNVEAIYKLDKRGAFNDPHDQEAREMVYSRTAAGARMLRDLVYRAWLESALPPTPGKPNPIDLNNPLYNPETGSAPAAVSPEVTK
ncbi:nuclease [Edaphobacter aggregans]|uniref:nuclease n=1 Tax=Edaphobacter aggregans TaxID=570835 RepID=UPI00054E7B47|nr:nuclease [Edaphobacter aggregans]